MSGPFMRPSKADRTVRTPVAAACLTLVAAITLAACGGRTDVEAPPPPITAVPDSAAANSNAFITFVGGLVKDDWAPGLTMDGFVAPKSETELPQLLEGFA